MTSTAARREPVTRDRAITAAVALADARGLGSLSMRRLAQELGVEAMSLYHHVDGKAALLAGVADAVMAELELPDPALPWDERLLALARGYRALAHRHPHVFPLLVTGSGPAAGAAVGAILAALRDAGLEDPLVGTAYAALVSLVEGFAMEELTGALVGTPAGGAGEADAHFTRAVELLLDGVRAALAR
jgi:AcrR family transcriptional regulator